MKTKAERDAVRVEMGSAVTSVEKWLRDALDAADELERERDEANARWRNCCADRDGLREEHYRTTAALEAQLKLADEFVKAVELMATAPIAGSVRVEVTGNAYLEARRGK